MQNNAQKLIRTDKSNRVCRPVHALLYVLACFGLFAALSLTAGCSGGQDLVPRTETTLQKIPEEAREIGEGNHTFSLEITDLSGIQTYYKIRTDEPTVGEALKKLGLIEGEEGPYGLMITAVGGVRAVYEIDHAYWAFYVDGQYAMNGIDLTPAEDGHEYALRVERA